MLRSMHLSSTAGRIYVYLARLRKRRYCSLSFSASTPHPPSIPLLLTFNLPRHVVSSSASHISCGARALHRHRTLVEGAGTQQWHGHEHGWRNGLVGRPNDSLAALHTRRHPLVLWLGTVEHRRHGWDLHRSVPIGVGGQVDCGVQGGDGGALEQEVCVSFTQLLFPPSNQVFHDRYADVAIGAMSRLPPFISSF